MTEDTLDIELSEADFDEMDVSQLKGIYDKLRQSRDAVRAEREALAGQLKVARDSLNKSISTNHHLLEQARQRDARLARVAMRMIDAGLLDTMSGPQLTEGKG